MKKFVYPYADWRFWVTLYVVGFIASNLSNVITFLSVGQSIDFWLMFLFSLFAQIWYYLVNRYYLKKEDT